MPVVEFTTPNDFFKAKVENAASGLQVDLSTELEFYLVNLLCEFIQPQNLKIGDMNLLDTPLALIYKQALEAPPQMQVKVYKKLGDISLYVAGYFQASLSRKTVGRSYYISMGSSAYQKMSNIMKNRHREMHFTQMYRSLSQEFKTLVAIITRVSEGLPRDNENLYAFYEKCYQDSEEFRNLIEPESESLENQIQQIKKIQ